MNALVRYGEVDVRRDTGSGRAIEPPRKAITTVTAWVIRGPGPHPCHIHLPATLSGDNLDRGTQGEVTAGERAAKHKGSRGDHVVIPFRIVCGQYDQRKRSYSLSADIEGHAMHACDESRDADRAPDSRARWSETLSGAQRHDRRHRLAHSAGCDAG